MLAALAFPLMAAALRREAVYLWCRHVEIDLGR
jgi:hypothetical protein